MYCITDTEYTNVQCMIFNASVQLSLTQARFAVHSFENGEINILGKAADCYCSECTITVYDIVNLFK